LEVSASLIKLIISVLSQRKFGVSVKGEMPRPMEMLTGVPQGSVLSPKLYSMYINENFQTLDVHLALFACDTCMYATDRKEGYSFRKLQRSLNSTDQRCKCWNIELNEDKTPAFYFSHRFRPPGIFLTLNGRNIPV
jgi:hypothetical protein